MRRVVLAALAALLVVAGCAKPDDPAAPPVGMEGVWIGSTPPLRTITFGHGVMKIDRAGMQTEYEVKYTYLTTVNRVSVEGVNKGSGQPVKMVFNILVAGAVLRDDFGVLDKKASQAGR